MLPQRGLADDNNKENKFIFETFESAQDQYNSNNLEEEGEKHLENNYINHYLGIAESIKKKHPQ